MKKERPHLVATEENKILPVLIIDKKGFLGASLSAKLKEQFLLVLVSGRELEFHQNIIHIPFRRKIPVIPDNTYSHIFVFYDGEEEIESILPVLMQKANSQKGKIFLIVSIGASSKRLFQRLVNHLYNSLVVIIYGEVFDENASFSNMVNYFIYQARTNNRLVIPNEGIGKLYPVYLEDLLAVIIATAYSQEIQARIIHAFPRFPLTEMTVARIFQKLNPTLKIDFNKRKINNPNYFIPPDGYYIFKSYDLHHGLSKISMDGEHRQAPQLKTQKIITTKRAKSFKRFWGALYLITIAPTLIALFAILTAAAFLGVSQHMAERGNFKTASSLSESAAIGFAVAETSTQNNIPLDLVGYDLKGSAVQKIRIGKHIAEAGSDLFHSFDTFSKIYNSPDRVITRDEFIEAIAKTKGSLLKLEEMKAQKHLPKEISEKIEKYEYPLTLFENTIDTLPNLLGFEGKKKYLVLFQNNMEIRPTGGFIGSFAIMDMENGKVPELKIHDVYDSDGKLTTHIEPPFGLRRFGGVSHWFLRDSNFSVDFVTNAAASSDILKRSIGEEVDGVIAVDTNFIKNILEALGTVSAEDYKENVNSENFYLLTQKHAEEKFFPGSTQKKDFLRALMNSILQKIEDQKELSYLSLLNAMEKSIKEKHILVAFSAPALQKVYSVNNLSGALSNKTAKSQNTYADFFATMDANIGGNKANYYLKRQISQEVTVADSGQLFGSATVVYENTSRKDSIFGGDYGNYLRFVLPEGADLRSVLIDSVRVDIIEAITNSTQYTSPNFQAPVQLEIETEKIDGNEVVAFFVKVPVQTSKKVTISYSIPQIISTESSTFTYTTRIVKQPGTDRDPFTLVLNYPARYRPIDLSSEYVDLGGKIRFETLLNKDKDIRIQFSAK